MTRRDASWMILRAASVAGASEFFSSWVRAAPHGHGADSIAPPDPHDWNSYQPKFFPPEDFRSLDIFSAILIPTDDTPGAREAHVSAFIDFVVNAAAEYAPEMQRQWRKSMNWLRAQNFGRLAPEERFALVRAISEPERDRSKRHEGFPVYRLLKDMTMHAFYTSRAGLVDVLEYKGYAYLTEFPACTHPEHHEV
ncbi:MAG: gluconate 2-dehydrogenase subunit 3 family protein [Bryobacteraceae bacterium]